MRVLKHLLRSHMSACLHCGSLQNTDSRLCVPCGWTLQSYAHPSISANVSARRMRALYLWRPGQSDLLSSLLLSLKGPRSRQTWEVYAQQFLNRHMHSLPLGRRIRFVPAPSKSGGEDHASLFARALAKQLGAEFVPCLQKSSPRTQRGSQRGERALIEMSLVEKNTELSTDWSEALWIFVDDIFTTGSTARAAELALGSPPHFEIWVLAERSLSCGASTDLL